MIDAPTPTALPSPTVRRSGRSLVTRIGAIILVTAALVGAIAVAVSERMVEDQQQQALLRRATLVGALQADALSGPVWELDARSAQAMIVALRSRDSAIRYAAVFESGDAKPLAAEGDPADAAHVMTIEQPIHQRDAAGAAGRPIGTLRLVFSTAEVSEAVWKALLPIVGLLLLSLLTTVAIISGVLNRIVLRPLANLTRVAQAVARGEYGARLATRREDEIGVLTRSFNRMAETVQDYTQTLESRVRERTEALADINRRIMDGINYAQLIQSSILPKGELLNDALAEHFVLWRPRDVVSGDFYYFRALDDGFLIGVADCTGHGVPGAFMTMTASAILNSVVDALGGGDPAAVLAEVDDKVRAALHQDSAAASWEGGFDNGLDLALCRVRSGSDRMIFAGARLPLLTAGPDGIDEIRGDRRSLGYRRPSGPRAATQPPFTSHEVMLNPNHTYYICTDGLTDQCGGERGRGFGKGRLREILSGSLDRTLAEQKNAIATALAGFQSGRAQRDDITMIGFRVRPYGTFGAGRESNSHGSPSLHSIPP